MKKLEIGQEVMVNDDGLMLLQQFAPKGSRPNNAGWVSEEPREGMVMICFPIGDDDPNEHSQAACYPEHQVYPSNWTETWPITKPDFSKMNDN